MNARISGFIGAKRRFWPKKSLYLSIVAQIVIFVKIEIVSKVKYNGKNWIKEAA